MFWNFVLEFSAISILCSWGSREALNSELCLFRAYTLAESAYIYTDHFLNKHLLS